MNTKKILVALSIFFASITTVRAADLDLDIDFKYVSGSDPKVEIVHKEGSIHSKDMAYDDLIKVNDIVNDSKVMSDKDSDFQVVDGKGTYELTVTQSGSTKHFKWSPGHAPREMKPLIQYMENRAQKSVEKAKK